MRQNREGVHSSDVENKRPTSSPSIDFANWEEGEGVSCELERLRAENAQLREKAVDLALEIQVLREGTAIR